MFGNATFRVHINTSATYLFTVSDPNDTYVVNLRGSLPPSSDYSLSRNGDAYNFTWTPTSLSPVQLLFIANDSLESTTILHPEVRICGCALNLNATCIESSKDGGDNLFIVQDCKCGSGRLYCVHYQCYFVC